MNIGVLLREAANSETVVRFTREWARVRCLDPDADVTLLEAGFKSEIRLRLADERRVNPANKEVPVSAVLKELEDSFSNSIQLTPAKACLAESMVAEVEQLMRIYVEPRSVRRLHGAPAGRRFTARCAPSLSGRACGT